MLKLSTIDNQDIPEMPVKMTRVLGHLLLAEPDSTTLALEVISSVQLLNDALLSLLQSLVVRLKNNLLDGSTGQLQLGCLGDWCRRHQVWRRLDQGSRSDVTETRDASTTGAAAADTKHGPVKLVEGLEQIVDVDWLHLAGHSCSQCFTAAESWSW